MLYQKLNAYWRLMRFDKPVGIWLLWFPTAWGLWSANHTHPPFSLVFIFALGTVVMRASGCVVNDLADRRFDIHVTRTKQRPVATGEVPVGQGVGVLLFLLCCALAIVLQLPTVCLYYAIVALLITVIYPFCKRFLHAPQLILGLAFSMGIPMTYAASGKLLDSVVGLLLAINFLWVVAYDTLYAMVDRADDVKIGVKSSAILFGRYDITIVTLLLLFCHLGWIPVAILLKRTAIFYIVWAMGAAVLCHQIHLARTRDEIQCLKAFRSSSWYGLVMWLALMVS